MAGEDNSDAAAPPTEDPGPLKYRTITRAEAHEYEPLHDFSCGSAATCDGDELKAAEEVHKILNNLYINEAVPQTVVLAEKVDDGILVAVCSVCDTPLTAPGVAVKTELPEGGHGVIPLPALPGNGAAINAIACEERYSGHGAGARSYATRSTKSSL
jgi:hypothetical protein